MQPKDFVMLRCLFFVCATLVLLTSCSTTATTSAPTAQNPPLRVGVAPDYPPVIYKQDGTLRGIEADLATYAGAKLACPVHFVEMPFEELVPCLERGEIDVIMSGLSNTDARREVVRFTVPYLHIGQMALLRSADAARITAAGALSSFTGRAGCLSGTTGEMYVKENMAQAECVAFADAPAAIAALRANQIDVLIDDGPYVLFAVKEYPELQALPWQLTDESLAWAVSKQASGDFLYEKLNRVLLHARQNGDLRKTINAYLDIQVRAR
jgi:polar amino acid transport system substrate-binding protein